ncbi:MAG TPA: M20/M25/M40 family metallo-hydrolase, partial [Actinospica sp.]|nr:M20/M25/M40 family metallo-hydrolase [Actinospica sp.]
MLPRDASIADLFLALVAVPSPSGHERTLGEQVRDWLADAGVAAEFDLAGTVNGSDAGNLIATIAGSPDAPGCLFVAHIDTVESGAPAVRPQLDADGVIRSSGDTILGADNKSAVAAVMRLCAAVNRLPVARRPTVVAAFTCREESGRMGVSLLDLPVAVQCAFCVDGSKPVGTVITRALGQTVFSFAVHGRAAHAAADPEAGISAIRVASEIVAELPIGRLPGGGSASIAAIV